MVVHSLHVAGWKNQDPSIEILPAVKIHATLAFFSFLCHLENVLYFHADLLFCLSVAADGLWLAEANSIPAADTLSRTLGMGRPAVCLPGQGVI
jgi:hypothetical protein